MMASVLSWMVPVAGGIFLGTYPTPIKCQAVRNADVHPFVFQAYKSAAVFIAGCLFLISPLLHSLTPFPFTFWAVASAASWVPAGICVIAAVPRIGCAMNMAIASVTATAFSFAAGVFLLGDKVSSMPIAAALLAGCVMCLVGMVAAYASSPHWLCCCDRSFFRNRDPSSTPRRMADADAEERCGVNDAEDVPLLILTPPSVRTPQYKRTVAGLVLAALAGAFASGQFVLVSWGRRQVQASAGCRLTGSTCQPAVLATETVTPTTSVDAHALPDVPSPPCVPLCSPGSWAVRALDPLGGWNFAFGVGAVVVTAAVLSLRALGTLLPWLARGGAAPRAPVCLSPHFDAVFLPGLAAGACWVVGNFLTQLAVVRWGVAVAMPMSIAFVTITSGAWGILYYREVRPCAAVVWFLFAGGSVVCSVLLAQLRR
eukprot:TRINITY_DN10769_c0_g1_i1.p1 TRINITY_DN10769_c0_g1~~TRINITY_DN10769_c0_g1_i1.p1  ORF type:complete len:428 (+),score=26.93 TRINITY_DN10769_c0_g1_i1:19-1302(+)